MRWETVDKQKGKQLYEENVKAVYKYLFCLTHNADLAEELTKVIETQRAYGMALKMVQTSDEIESTINSLSS